jgi:CubicO group peptidase (beta-lactamase class C family)
VRQLLQMASGLHWNFFRDYSQQPSMNRVDDALTLPFDHAPGTYFEYAQSAVALTAQVVASAADTEFQAFVQKELLGPLGIASGSWSWKRDAAGNTLAFMGLQMRPRDYARLGQLMLQRGVWGGRRLLADAYVTAATTSSPSNPGYGWFWWVNAGTSFIGPTIQSRNDFARRFVESAPPDMYSAAGSGDQLVTVIPSLDLVLTRSSAESPSGRGQPGSAGPTGKPELKHELLRRLMRAVTDTPRPDPGPYQAKGPVTSPDPNYGIAHSATETDDRAAGRSTPPLPPAGPAVARAALIGGAALHGAPLTVRVGREGRARVAITCPRVGRSACSGSATLTRSGARKGSKVSYRAGRGRRVKVRIALDASARSRLAGGGTQAAVVRVSNHAKAGVTTSQAKVTLKPR